MTSRPLWLEPGRLHRVKSHLQANQPTARAIFEQARAVAALPAGEAFAQSAQAGNARSVYVDSCVIVSLITGEHGPARNAADFLFELTRPWTSGQLSLGAWAMAAAILADACFDLLDRERQIRLVNLLIDLVDGQREVEFHKGNPHVVTNNHWAVSHGGAAMAAMAAHGRPTNANGTLADMTEHIEWARGRVKAFLHHHGDRAMYHEGLGYMMYPAGFWLPTLIAVRNHDGIDWLAEFPQLRQMAASLFASVATRPRRSDSDRSVSGIGMKLSWNDDGIGWSGGNTPILAIACAPSAQQGALRTMYDRLSGIEGDQSFCPDFHGRFFSFLYYPYDAAPADPDAVLPKHLCDTRQGLAIFRNRYRDRDDALLGCYARTTFVGGHAHDDAGSIRLMALDHDWIMGGGQARGDARWQSIVIPSEGSRPKPAGCGAVMLDEPSANGGVFAMDLRKSTGAYHERYVAVDFARQPGVDVAVAVLDVVDDHLNRAYQWNMTFEQGLRCEIHPDQKGFTLRADDGALMQARFLGATPTTLELTQTPDSSRTFQAGERVNYPGRPVVHAEFAFAPFLAIYVVMTVQRGSAPTIAHAGSVNVTIDGQPWSRPFGPAVPKAYELGRSGGFCKYPAGVVGFRSRPGKVQSPRT